MKKQLLLFVLMLLPMVAWADAVEINGICYNLIPKAKLAEVTNRLGGSSSTNGDNSYYGSIAIPASVTHEGIDYSVTSIGKYAFKMCTGLTSVTIPNSVTSIGNHAFDSCSGLTSVTIPNSVTSIGNHAFDSCSGLTSVTIPNSVTSIGRYAFSFCHGLTSLTIPYSVTSIDNQAFAGCIGLTSVTIPNSVTSIGNQAFMECIGLTQIFVENGNPKYDSRNNCNAIIETATNTLISGCKSTIIPNDVTSIGNSAFFGCSGLTSLTIPNSVTSIGNQAFALCSGLTYMTIPNSVTSIGDRAFSSCSGLTSVTIPNSVTSIGGGAFQHCSGLTSVNIGNSVTSIGENAFLNCTGLTSVTIPNSVTSIGYEAFNRCSGLTSVTIGNSVRNIGSLAFAKCDKLETVKCLAENVPSTDASAFQDSYPQYMTLYVPEGSINAYRTTVPWSEFGTFKTLDGTDVEIQKCATPAIFYGNKKLLFNCETEGVEYVYEIKDADIKKGCDSEIQLSATYEISVYATKAGYENSDVATATLVWGSATFTETTGQATAAPAINAESPLLIQSDSGVLTIQGASDDTKIGVYNINGTLAGEGVCHNGIATISTNLQSGSMAIIKIGDRSVKVAIK